MPMNAAADVSASLMWCQASPFTDAEPISDATPPTHLDNADFTTITTTSTSSVHQAGA